jgi:hypothetical protein
MKKRNMKKYAVMAAFSSGTTRKVFDNKKDADAFYTANVEKLKKKPGFVHMKDAETLCVLKGRVRDPHKKEQKIPTGCPPKSKK